jgi:hypothetical protein
MTVLKLLWWVDIKVNWLTGGAADETISARVGRNAFLDNPPSWFWDGFEKALDGLFAPIEPRHSYASYLRYLKQKATS